ncbi:MAG: hypothetical protein AB7F59_13135 [Bdellovibrionales bacterium]
MANEFQNNPQVSGNESKYFKQKSGVLKSGAEQDGADSFLNSKTLMKLARENWRSMLAGAAVIGASAVLGRSRYGMSAKAAAGTSSANGTKSASSPKRKSSSSTSGRSAARRSKSA